MNSFKERSCPVCGQNKHELAMRFTAEQLTEGNKSYRLEIINEIMKKNSRYLVYHQCQNCGLLYFPYFWPSEVVKELYGKAIDHAISRAKIYSPVKRAELHQQASDLYFWLGKRDRQDANQIAVLDYGCGWGDFLSVIKAPGVVTYGVEQDPEKAAWAAGYAHKIFSSAEALPKNMRFDVIALNSVLEHVQEVDETMDIIDGLLKPEGLLLLTVMDYRAELLRKNKQLLRQGKAPSTKNLNPLEHVNVFDYLTLSRLLKKHRYDVKATALTTNLVRCWRMPITVLNRLESWSAKVVNWRELSITVYAARQAEVNN